MNWIKITPETEIPDGKILIGWWDNNEFQWTVVWIDGYGYTTQNPTHYCIITNPEN